MATLASPRVTAPRRRMVPLVGQTLAYFHAPLDTLRYHYERNGPVSDYSFVGRPWNRRGPSAVAAELALPGRWLRPPPVARSA